MLLRGCLVASFALVAAPAQVIPVAATSLAAAIQAAPPGATLLVSGSGGQVSANVDKDVTLVAVGPVTIFGDLSVNVGTLHTLRIVGFDVSSYYAGYPPFGSVLGGAIQTNGNLQALDCDCRSVAVDRTVRGHVFLRHVTTSGGNSTLHDVDAVLVDCSMIGSTYHTSWLPAPIPQPALTITGSLRAERCAFRMGPGSAPTPHPWLPPCAAVVSHGDAILADCTLECPPQFNAWGLFLDPGDTAILSNTVNPAGSSQPTTLQLMPTASLSGALSLGASRALTCREQPNALVAIVLAGDLLSWSSPFAQGRLWFGATPNWTVAAIGVTDTAGAFAYPFTIPNIAALQYTVGWFTGVFVDPLPLRTTAPIGGMIR
jgi:hypothetical protein